MQSVGARPRRMTGREWGGRNTGRHRSWLGEKETRTLGLEASVVILVRVRR